MGAAKAGRPERWRQNLMEPVPPLGARESLIASAFEAMTLAASSADDPVKRIELLGPGMQEKPGTPTATHRDVTPP